MTPSAAGSPAQGVHVRPCPAGSFADLVDHHRAVQRVGGDPEQRRGKGFGDQCVDTEDPLPVSDARSSVSAGLVASEAPTRDDALPSTAALAAATASSTLAPLSAVSVAAPTLMTATPPASLASRSLFPIPIRIALADLARASPGWPPLLRCRRRQPCRPCSPRVGPSPAPSKPTSRSTMPASGLDHLATRHHRQVLWAKRSRRSPRYGP